MGLVFYIKSPNLTGFSLVNEGRKREEKTSLKMD